MVAKEKAEEKRPNTAPTGGGRGARSAFRLDSDGVGKRWEGLVGGYST